MKITIIGAGNTAVAAACFLKTLGLPSLIYTRREERAKQWNESPVKASGAIAGSFSLESTTDLAAAVHYGDILLVCTLAADHETVVSEIAPYLSAHQSILFFNGCWGALKAYRTLLKRQDMPPLTIGETANMPFIAALSQDGSEILIKGIKEELAEQVTYFKEHDQLIEAQRIAERTNFDIEMLRETGFCSGIENYSRHLAGLEPGQPPSTLIDFFGDDFLMIIDESHITVPQIGGMYAGDQSRKSTLVDFGFRLPSAKDNRPLEFGEFEQKIDQMLFVSATPGKYEEEHELLRAEQIIRPTGLLDPAIDVRPVEGQIDDLLGEIHKETDKGNKVLVTTLTKRMAEELTDYMREVGIRVKYLHSDIDTLERIEIVRDLRMGVFDVLVGINLLREGLDIPEITLVAILDADKEGFLRSETSLVQTIGRAARNSEGHVIMYADHMTDSMHAAITETERRREIQDEYNKEHGITPQTIKKDIRDLIKISDEHEEETGGYEKDMESMSKKELKEVIERLSKKMNQAAAELNFELAAQLRDELKEFKIAYQEYDD